jgi:catechol 2,3-dioxygenase-like lactoylglutathione lyase family enzyme
MEIDHLILPVRDYAASKRFYEWALRPLGLVLVLDWPERRRAWFGVEGSPSSLWLSESPLAGSLELCLVADDAEAVDAFHAAAVSAGGRPRWEPGVRPEFNRHYYAARVLDPDGNSIEAVYRGAAAASALQHPAAA